MPKNGDAGGLEQTATALGAEKSCPRSPLTTMGLSTT
jgi:hypothetical protein